MNEEIKGEELFKERYKKKYLCENCKDTGKVIKKARVYKCTECDTNSKKLFLTEETEETIDQKLEGVVPERLRGMIFDANKIKNDIRVPKEIKGGYGFTNYLDTLTEIYNAINTNTELKYSILITAPQGMGKTSLVYSCLNAAARNGKTIAPYLDSLEINSLLIKDQHDIIDTLVNAEVCFIKIPTTNLVGAMRSLVIILDRRARKGLPTVVTSRFDLDYLYRIDFNLERLFIAKNFGDHNVYDYSRLRVLSSPYETRGWNKKNK